MTLEYQSTLKQQVNLWECSSWLAIDLAGMALRGRNGWLATNGFQQENQEVMHKATAK